MDGTAKRAAAPTVVIDGYSLADGSLVRGIGRYLTHLLAGLAARDDITPLVLTPSPDVVPEGVATRRIVRRGGWRFGRREHEFRFPRELRRAGGDLLHSPAQHPPRTVAMPWVQTLLDLTPLKDGAGVSTERQWWERVGGRLRDAAAIMAISNATARIGVEKLGLDSKRVHVVHLGVDSGFAPPAGGPDTERPYLLIVASYGPHKGHAVAFDVIGALADAGAPHRLVVGGHQDAWMSAQLEAARLASAHPERVEMSGYVNDLAALYGGATALIVASRSEGFCLPALEAMACGTPVVAFDNTALPEVVGAGGILVPDGDAGAMVDALRRIIDEPSLRRELSECAIAQASRFRWEDMVNRHVEIYRAVAGV